MEVMTPAAALNLLPFHQVEYSHVDNRTRQHVLTCLVVTVSDCRIKHSAALTIHYRAEQSLNDRYIWLFDVMIAVDFLLSSMRQSEYLRAVMSYPRGNNKDVLYDLQSTDGANPRRRDRTLRHSVGIFRWNMSYLLSQDCRLTWWNNAKRDTNIK